ncbi:COMM domain-containing protein 3 [Tribolium madens]|uniref:COMM domain-containing protein 3 n=1 Tax=Tribolium madens TaxID=41895 RepID=UPI001CF74DEB|nr:COMM domain-containing protein 3 [Tribolium madens]XP_044260957.1 COMM domain-containing protein 3 [Tribolium madens]
MRENLQKSLVLANNLPDATFRKLLENCFATLTGFPEPHSISSLYNSKPDLIKELYAALLSLTANLVQTGQNKENTSQFLSQCHYSGAKTGLFLDFYEKNRCEIEASLVNIGNHLPHITDITWKIDYIIKSSYLDCNQGPIFRIGLQTEKYDPENECKKVDFLQFTCDSQELQDLVYKLKDAVRHCQRIGSEH